MNWGDVPAWVGIIAALATGAYAAYIARDAKEATEDQASEMRRSNAIAEEALRISKAAHQPTVAWTVEHESGDTYKVTNVGTADAWDIEIQHEGLVLSYSDGTQQCLRPTEAAAFMATVHMQTRDNNVYVRWADEAGGEQRTWRHPLPGRPPR